MSLNTVRLRPMRRADVDELVDLLRCTWYADGDPQVQTMVARADLEFCLARTTTAIVAEYQEHPVGVALGHIDRKSGGRFPVNRHHKAACKAMLRLMRTAEGRRGAHELMVLGVEGELMSVTARRQGHTYDAEVILLILDRMMQGSGVGARLFDGMEQAFRQAGAQRYFLYTNTGCNVGFYDHRGLTRRIERTVPGKDGSATTYYLYDSVL